ncbi:hypothetical protein DFH09DRAFT_1308926 [Mycena vulgaris]|nr:hypothetical protein DFH09DRAFT_1308926 [Mycena vulgaris]
MSRFYIAPNHTLPNYLIDVPPPALPEARRPPPPLVIPGRRAAYSPSSASTPSLTTGSSSHSSLGSLPSRAPSPALTTSSTRSHRLGERFHPYKQDYSPWPEYTGLGYYPQHMPIHQDDDIFSARPARRSSFTLSI